MLNEKQLKKLVQEATGRSDPTEALEETVRSYIEHKVANTGRRAPGSNTSMVSPSKPLPKSWVRSFLSLGSTSRITWHGKRLSPTSSILKGLPHR